MFRKNFSGGLCGGVLGILLGAWFGAVWLIVGCFAGSFVGYWHREIAYLLGTASQQVQQVSASLSYDYKKWSQEPSFPFWRLGACSGVILTGLLGWAYVQAFTQLYRPDSKVLFNGVGNVGLVLAVMALTFAHAYVSMSRYDRQETSLRIAQHRLSRFGLIGYLLYDLGLRVVQILCTCVGFTLGVMSVILSVDEGKFVAGLAMIPVAFARGVYHLLRRPDYLPCAGVTIATTWFSFMWFRDVTGGVTLGLVALATGVMSGVLSAGIAFVLKVQTPLIPMFERRLGHLHAELADSYEVSSCRMADRAGEVMSFPWPSVTATT